MSISYRKGVVDQTTTKKTKMQSLQMHMKDVLSQSSKLDTSMRDKFSDTLKWLKGIDKVYISPDVRAEIDATFGSLDSSFCYNSEDVQI